MIIRLITCLLFLLQLTGCASGFIQQGQYLPLHELKSFDSPNSSHLIRFKDIQHAPYAFCRGHAFKTVLGCTASSASSSPRLHPFVACDVFLPQKTTPLILGHEIRHCFDPHFHEPQAFFSPFLFPISTTDNRLHQELFVHHTATHLAITFQRASYSTCQQKRSCVSTSLVEIPKPNFKKTPPTTLCTIYLPPQTDHVSLGSLVSQCFPQTFQTSP